MMTAESNKPSLLSSLGSLSSLLAVVTCYGTLVGIALLSLIGISVDISETVLVKIILVLLTLALFGMVYSFRFHRYPGPLVLSLAAAGLLLWVFFGSYSKVLEIAGFAGLLVASVWDFWVKKRACAVRASA